MKHLLKKLTFVCLLLTAAMAAAFAQNVAINSTTFPDDNFRAWALAQPWGSDAQITPAEITGVKSINVSGSNIADLTGINYFTGLQTLNCTNNQLTALNISLSALQYLDCYNNQLTALDVSSSPYIKGVQAQNQTPTLALTAEGAVCSAAIALNNPTPSKFAAGVTYAAGKLTSNSIAIASTPFEVTITGSSTKLSGTFSLQYSAVVCTHYFSALGTQVSAATCTAPAQHKAKCSLCGEEHATLLLNGAPALGHDFSTWVANPNDMYEKVETCSRCGEPSGNIQKKPVWKILWAIFENVDVTSNGVRRQNTMTADEIEMVKIKADWYKEFVEKYADVELQITKEVIHTTVTEVGVDETGNYFWGFPMPIEDRFRLQPEDNFDCQIYTADYTGMATTWAGLCDGSRAWVVFSHSHYGGFEPSFVTKQFQTNIYVHEWIHLLESHFASLGEEFRLPTLHGSSDEYAYTYNNTGGLSGEFLMEKWYSDNIRGTVESYPGATGTRKGVNPDWWQYTPLSLKNVKTTPANYTENVPIRPVFTIEWQNPVYQQWATGQFNVCLSDAETGQEIGFYEVTGLMSADRKSMIVDFSQPLYKTWEGKYEIVNLEYGKTYRFTSYTLAYDNAAVPLGSADFSITFTTESCASGIAVNKTNFPDANFRTWILSQSWGRDACIPVSEIRYIRNIDVSNLNISDLT